MWKIQIEFFFSIINLFSDTKNGLKMFFLGAHCSSGVGTQTVSVVRVLRSSFHQPLFYGPRYQKVAPFYKYKKCVFICKKVHIFGSGGNHIK